MTAAAEEKVKRLAKLKSNTICPNCGTEKKFGFGSVCIKFYIFVCNECKSSHQAISHRCKSTTMSTWTDEEVAELERTGNDYCRRTWLKNAPPCGQNGRPQPGSDMAIYKRFVVDAYEHKRYHGSDDGPAPATASASVPPPAFASRPTPSAAPRTVKAFAAPASAPLPKVVDLLDFSAPVASMPPSASGSTDIFGDFASAPGTTSFQAFPSPPSTNQTTASTPVPAPSNDLFASLNQRTPVQAAPASAGFDAFAMSGSVSASVGANPSSTLADFEGLSISTAAPGAKKPIMGSAGQGNAISMISTIPPPLPHQQGLNMVIQQQNSNINRVQQQGGMMMNQQMNMMSSGMNPQVGMNPQMQQQFMMMQQQQMAMQYQRQQMMGANQFTQMNGTGMNNTMGGMNAMTQQFGGMAMNNTTGSGMMMGGMNSGNTMNGSFLMGAPTQQQQRKTTSDQSGMPGGNVMDMLAYTQKKK
jgi:hypothetical protein